MKKYRLNLKVVLGVILAFSFIACVRSPEHGSVYYDAGPYLGFWHGLILPFSVFGKMLNFDIGIHVLDPDAGYWIGYFAGLVLFIRFFMWISFLEGKSGGYL